MIQALCKLPWKLTNMIRSNMMDHSCLWLPDIPSWTANSWGSRGPQMLFLFPFPSPKCYLASQTLLLWECRGPCCFHDSSRPRWVYFLQNSRGDFHDSCWTTDYILSCVICLPISSSRLQVPRGSDSSLHSLFTFSLSIPELYRVSTQ